MIDGMRHVALYNPEQFKEKRVAIVGAGTIGSHLALTLARMQVPFTIYDFDTIERHNLATQSYTEREIGRYKVDAVAQQCEDIGAEPGSVVAERREFSADSTTRYDIVISCVDSLEARRAIGEALIAAEYPGAVHDGRVGAEQVEVYRYPDAAAWLAELPAQADDDPCGARFTAYTANICAGLMANNVKRELLGQTVQKRILYDAVSSSFLKPS